MNLRPTEGPIQMLLNLAEMMQSADWMTIIYAKPKKSELPAIITKDLASFESGGDPYKKSINYYTILGGYRRFPLFFDKLYCLVDLQIKCCELCLFPL